MSKKLTYKSGVGTAHFDVDKSIMNDQIARAAFYQEVCIKLADFEENFEWISVEKSLPERDRNDKDWSVYVLALFENRKTQEVLSLNFSEGEWINQHEDRMYDFDEITHWMPLPEPPKED